MSDLTAVSLFAGIGGFDLALHKAGVHVAAAVELDPDCRGVLARHFPKTTLFDDVRKVTGGQIRAAGFVSERGIMAGGWPCQDLSIAGRRSGLGGARSGLFWEIVRLAGELRPRWLLLENVDDLLSSACPCPGDGSCVDNGRSVQCGKLFRDQWQPGVQHNPPGGVCRGGCMAVHGGAMGAVVGALEQLGYGLCWRVLDAQYAGVPQRRERLFFAGCLGDGAAPVQVLLEPESCEGDFAARGPAGQGHPRRAPGGAGGPGAVASTLQGGGRRGHRIDAEGAAGGHLVALPFALRGREDGSNIECGQPGPPAFTLRTPGGGSSHPMIAAFSENQRGEVLETSYSRQLTTGGGKPGQGYGAVRQGTAVRRLTPLERERLQGLPDDWTRWKLKDGRLVEQSDSARDRQTGNAVAVPVVAWITRRIAAVEAVSEARGAA